MKPTPLFLGLLLLSPALLRAEESDQTMGKKGTAIAGDTKVFQADADWIAVDWKRLPIAPGSALDFSGNLDAPAGKWGRVVNEDGHWAFQNRPGQPARFYGNHLTHGLPYVPKEQADQLADYIAASGFNLIRFHTYTFVKGVLKDDDRSQFAPEKLDQLDYIFAALKKRGVYSTIVLSMGNFFQAGDVTDVPEFAGKEFRFEIGGLLPISADARAWFKKYAANLLGHKNPYTGLALKDDPALITVELDNENGVFREMEVSPAVQAAYRRLCRESLQKKGGAAPADAEVEAALPGFAQDRQAAFIQMASDYLRGIGVTQPLTDITNRNNLAYALPRSRLDYVDCHDYWDLYKRVPDEKPASGTDPVYHVRATNPAAQALPWTLQVAGVRIFGLPFACGEFNSDYPSPYWTFTGPSLAAAGGLQGWSTMIRCGLAPFPEGFFQPTRINRIEGGSSPLLMLSERIGAMLFAQDEIKPLPVRVPLVLTEDYLRSQLTVKGGALYPELYQQLGFQYQLGTIVLRGGENLDGYSCFVVPADMPVPDALKGRKVFPVDAQLAASVARAVPPGPSPWTWDRAAGTARIVTPRSETFLLPATAAGGEGACLKVSGNQTVSTSFAGSLDRKPLADSQHVLALYLTDARSTGSVIVTDKAGGLTVRSTGVPPPLIRQGRLTFAFKTGARPLPKIWALKGDGTRGAAVAPRKTADGFAFEAAAVTDAETFGAFELAWAL